MSLAIRKRRLEALQNRLRQRAANGDSAAMCELAMWLGDGLQDKSGRTIVRRNTKSAFRYALRASALGSKQAAQLLGYAYDVGQGTRRNRRLALHWYRRAVRDGSIAAMTNIATVHRDAGNLRLAFRWWKRAAEMGDGDAAVDMGYCYQYGIGTRRNLALAREMFGAADSMNTTAHGREAALYHLALSFIDDGMTRPATSFLHKAAADKDYPEAMSLLKQLQSKEAVIACRCRRHISKRLNGHAICRVHSR